MKLAPLTGLLIFSLAATVLTVTLMPHSPSIPNKPADIYSCTQNNECISVPADGCGCTAGGVNSAINKSFLKEWKTDHPGRGCLAVMSTDPYTCIGVEPKCIGGTCKFVKTK